MIGGNDPMLVTIDTGKHAAIKEAAGVAADADIDWDVIVNMLNLYNIYHRARGWVDAQVFRLEEKKAKAKKT